MAWGALRPMARLCRAAPRHGGGRGGAAAGTHPRAGHGAATGTGDAAHPAAGPVGGPASCDGKQGAGDARRQARAAHPRRAARSQPAGGPTGPVRWWGPRAPVPRAARELAAQTRHGAGRTPTGPPPRSGPTRPTTGRGKPANSHKGATPATRGVPPVARRRPGRIPLLAPAATPGRRAARVGAAPPRGGPPWAARKYGAAHHRRARTPQGGGAAFTPRKARSAAAPL